MERQDDAPVLGDYLAVLRQQLRLIAAVTLLVTLAGLGYFFAQTPQYEARSELILTRVRTAQDISITELLNPTGVIGVAEIAAASSLPVAARAAELLDRDDPAALRAQVAVDVVEGTQRLRFTGTSPLPEEAARIADAFANAFVEFRRDEAVLAVETVQAELEQRAEDLRAEIAAVDTQLLDLQPAPVRGQVEPTPTPSESSEATATPSDSAAPSETAAPTETAAPGPESESLQIRRQALQSQLAQVILRSTELGQSADALTGFSAAFTAAAVPTSPIGTDWVNAGGVSFILGLLLGIALAFTRDHFDDVIRNETDLKRATGGRPVLGRIPTWKPDSGAEESRLASVVEPSSHASEAYRELSAGVRFLLVARAEGVAVGDDSHRGLGRSRSVMVCSANIGEGKTATAANLAVAAARVGLRTVLVDTDLRRSAVAGRFGLGRPPGLSDALLNGEMVEDRLIDVSVPSLRVLTAGTIPPNPTELLASPAMRALHQRLVSLADLVVYDTPAILAVPDALEVGPFVDLAIVVARVGVTSRRRLASAIERLGQVGTDLSGTVLNGLNRQSDGYYYEEYYYTPEAEQAPNPKPKPQAESSTR